MTQDKSRRKIASAEALNDRNASPLSPTRTAAAPIAIAATMIWRTLNPTLVFALPSAITVSAPSPRKLTGTRPLRKLSQLPLVAGTAAAAASTPLRTPGWSARPRTSPIETAISAVIANQRSVRTTSRAASSSSRNAATEATIAVKTSGGTSALSNCTNSPPTVCSASPSAATPASRAIRPSATPATMPIATCTPNEGRRHRAAGKT